MLAEEDVPNTSEQKHETIVKRLNELLNGEIRASRRGANNNEIISHIQDQLRFHKGCLASPD